MRRYAIKTTYTSDMHTDEFEGRNLVCYWGKNNTRLAYGACNEEPEWLTLQLFGYKSYRKTIKAYNAHKRRVATEDRHFFRNVRVEIVEFRI